MSKIITYRGVNSVEAIAVGVAFRPGESLEVTDDEAAQLLTNHLFTDASGKNPNFTCARCGNERFATGIFRSGGIAPLETADHEPICAPCFTKAATPASGTPEAPVPAPPAKSAAAVATAPSPPASVPSPDALAAAPQGQ